MALSAGGCAYYSVDVQRASLEDIFLELTDSEDDDFDDTEDGLTEDDESQDSTDSSKTREETVSDDNEPESRESDPAADAGPSVTREEADSGEEAE